MARGNDNLGRSARILQKTTEELSRRRKKAKKRARKAGRSISPADLKPTAKEIGAKYDFSLLKCKKSGKAKIKKGEVGRLPDGSVLHGPALVRVFLGNDAPEYSNRLRSKADLEIVVERDAPGEERKWVERRARTLSREEGIKYQDAVLRARQEFHEKGDRIVYRTVFREFQDGYVEEMPVASLGKDATLALPGS